MKVKTQQIELPPPRFESGFSVEHALSVRRSIREYSKQPLTLAELGQLLWSCQGITSKEGFRTTPSAGAIFPLEIFAVVMNVENLAPGAYRYIPGPGFKNHRIELNNAGEFGAQLQQLSTTQEFIGQVPLNIILASHTQKMIDKYGDEFADRFVFMEMGHGAQNIHLQAEALGLGSVAIGVLKEEEVKELLNTSAQPQYMISVGRE